MRYKIMVADDDPAMVRACETWLEKAGYAVINCGSGGELLRKVGTSKPDLVLMDVLLGDADGMKLCEELRGTPGTSHIPVILISGAKTKDEDLITGLGGGADDYITKPFNYNVLAAKVGAVLRRFQAPQELDETLQHMNIELNVTERSVAVKGKKVDLTRKEFDLLTALLRKRDKVLSPHYLLETVWGYEIEDYNDPHTVQVHISRLKKKLGKSFSSRITNIVGSGYRLT